VEKTEEGDRVIVGNGQNGKPTGLGKHVKAEKVGGRRKGKKRN